MSIKHHESLLSCIDSLSNQIINAIYDKRLSKREIKELDVNISMDTLEDLLACRTTNLSLDKLIYISLVLGLRPEIKLCHK